MRRSPIRKRLFEEQEEVLVKLSRHAQRRIAARQLNQEEVEGVARKVAPLLGRKPLRISHRGLTVVARKPVGGSIHVVTAWGREGVA